MKTAIIVCGPTASGKSKFALNLALKLNTSIVNADSMQIYKDLPILSASPTGEEKKLVPHHLYNIYSHDKNASVADWLNQLKIILSNTNIPIITGGTGLYISSLLKGICYVPQIDLSVKEEVQKLAEEKNLEEIEELAKTYDPNIKAIDKQRLLRSIEVYRSTAKPLSYWQSQPNINYFPDYRFIVIKLIPERGFLYNLCNLRFITLLNLGAINEVESLKNKLTNLNIASTIGYKEIIDYLEGNISLNIMVERVQLKTTQYAKRQLTWFRNQFEEDYLLDFNNLSEYNIKSEKLINKLLLSNEL